MNHLLRYVGVVLKFNITLCVVLVQITMIPTPEQTKEIKENSLKFNQSKLKLQAMFIDLLFNTKLQRVSDNAHSALHRASGITPSETFHVLPYR